MNLILVEMMSDTQWIDYMKNASDRLERGSDKIRICKVVSLYAYACVTSPFSKRSRFGWLHKVEMMYM